MIGIVVVRRSIGSGGKPRRSRRVSHKGTRKNEGNHGRSIDRRRVSSFEGTPGTPRLVCRRQSRGYGPTHDLRDDGEVRRLPHLREVQTTPSNTHRRIDFRHPICHGRYRWWWGIGGIITLSESNEGQFLFQLCTELGVTLSDLAVMDPREVHFYVSALSAKNREEQRMLYRQKTKAAHSRLRGR